MGLIPAWAGKTTVTLAVYTLVGAHPRVGGENTGREVNVFLVSGSSPRGRGKRGHVLHGWVWCGLIPAWAGKTFSFRSLPRLYPAHPRVGGENSGKATCHAGSRGSSPRGRGKHPRLACYLARSRLIPAWAGKTVCCCVRLVAHRAHPRVGGENVIYPAMQALAGGSSPRGRGKPFKGSRRRFKRGLIPAWAGKTQLVRL